MAQSVTDGNIVQSVTDENFEQEVLKANRVVLVDFWAEWCSPCRMLTPVIEELAKDFTDEAKIVKMNIDDNPNIPSSLGIRSIPTLLMFKDGKQIDSKVGAISKDILAGWLKSNI